MYKVKRKRQSVRLVYLVWLKNSMQGCQRTKYGKGSGDYLMIKLNVLEQNKDVVCGSLFICVTCIGARH